MERVQREIVATLTLGSWPKQRNLQGCGPRGSLRVTLHAPESVGKCEGMNSHTPKWTSFLGDGVPVDSRIFRRWLQGSNLRAWRVPYIIEKLLERRCLKWARVTHLDTWNTSYGQKKGRESNCQFDSRPGSLTPDH
jgi:hypothetical protein